MALTKVQKRSRIKMRVKKVVTGTKERPRLSVFRSNKQIYAQLIDDISGHTLVSVSSLAKEITEKKDLTKTNQAKLVGEITAKSALSAGINEVVFDRNGYQYHGRVKSLAEAVREGGLKF